MSTGALQICDPGLLKKSAGCRILLTVIFLVLALLIIPCFMASGEAQAASISGRVTNGTTSPGWVYLSLDYSGSGHSSFGTAVYVNASGYADYTIRGVTDHSTYVVNAFLDVYGRTIQLANSPAGSTGSFSFSGSDISGKDITVSAPGSVALSDAVPPPNVFATSTAAFIEFGNRNSIKAGGLYVPESIKVKWGYASDSLTNVITVPVDDRGMFAILTGLSGGTLYGRLVPVVNGSEDTTNQSDIFSKSLTTPAGGSTLNGTVISTGISKSSSTPLGIVAMNDSGAYITIVSGTPADNQSYTITGLAAGTYQVHAILDMDNNGYMNVPDIVNDSNSQTPIIIVNGSSSYTVPDIVLSAGNVEAKNGTVHSLTDSGESFSLNFKIDRKQKQPVSATITAGPQLTVPIDLAWIGEWGQIQGWPWVAARPSVGDTYTVHVNYSDNTSENLSMPVIVVLDDFARPIFPKGDAAGSTTPIFSWMGVNATPTGYFDYSIWVNNGSIWDRDDPMPANQLSVLYNDDGNAYGSLSPGTGYTWTIGIEDAFGNKSQYQSSFTPLSSGPTVTGFTPTSGPSGTSVIITGTGFDNATPANNVVRFGGKYASVYNVDSSTQITTTVPAGAPVGPITVSVNGITGSSLTASSPTSSFTPTIIYPGQLKKAVSGNISGATVSTVGLAPFYSEVSTTTDATGLYSLTVPSGVPLSLRFSKPAYSSVDAYTAVMKRTSDSTSQTFALYTAADLATISGITPSAGKGLIGGKRARVSHYDSNIGIDVQGAVVTTISKNHGSNYYTVAYTDPLDSSKIVSGAGKSTHTDGIFYVLNVDEGDYVAVTATAPTGTYAGWRFETRAWVTHANALSESRLRGAPAPVVTPSPAAGTYCSAQSVTLTAGDSTACSADNGGCYIYYTTNGDDPRFFGANYEGPVSISSTATLRYYAYNGYVNGDLGSAAYVIGGAMPAVTTASITDITATTAAGGGNVTSDGGCSVTARGVCWSQSSNPTTSDTCTSNGTGAGSFASSITGLTASTPYHVRAFATNVVGTAYGDDVEFTTGSTKVDGVCGSSNGGTFATAPSTNLCNPGTPSSVSGAGSLWSWQCEGSNGGATVDCSANISCADRLVRIKESPDAFYSTIKAAYDLATDGQTVQIQKTDFAEGDLILNNGAAVTLHGGFDCAFSDHDGFSNVSSKVILRGGTVKINKIRIR
jgi:hypothetical protein